MTSDMMGLGLYMWKIKRDCDGMTAKEVCTARAPLSRTELEVPEDRVILADNGKTLDAGLERLGVRPEGLVFERFSYLKEEYRDSRTHPCALALAGSPKPDFALWCLLGRAIPNNVIEPVALVIRRTPRSGEYADAGYVLKGSAGTAMRFDKQEGGNNIVETQQLLDVIRRLHGLGMAHGNLHKANVIIEDGVPKLRNPTLYYDENKIDWRFAMRRDDAILWTYRLSLRAMLRAESDRKEQMQFRF